MSKRLDITVKNISPPIPYRKIDWAAFFSGSKDGPVGLGETEKEALQALYWLSLSSEQERAVAKLLGKDGT